MRLIGAVLIGALLFLLGFWSGNRSAREGMDQISSPLPLQPPRADAPAPPVTGPLAPFIAERDWEGLVEAVEAARLDPDPAVFQAAYDKLLAVARDLQAQEAAAESVRLLAAFVELNPYDTEALGLLSQGHELAGNLDLAIEPLITIAAYPPSPAAADAARSRMEALILIQAESFRGAGDLPGLVGFYRSLVVREPQFDGHRLGLAWALLETGEVAEAEGLLKEIGGVGVAGEELSRLRREVADAGRAPAIRRLGESLYADVEVADRKLKLLVDTGASVTAIRRSLLRAVDAQALDTRVQVATAGGPVVADLYRVSELVIGGRAFRDLEVVALEQIPGTVDGLLGMDLLPRVPGMPLP